MRDSEILWAAAGNVKRGWCKDKARDEVGNVCLARPIGDVIRPAVADFRLELRLLDALRDTLNGVSPIKFNDHPDTTKSNVLELLMTTAMRLEEEGL